MKQANTESKEKFLSQLEELYREKLEARLADDVMLFASQYFENLPVEEARGRRLEDIYGAVLSCWNFLNHHQVNQPKVEVFNPDLEENGWQSTHSVIAILHVNIPFLVDSIRLALNKAELTIHSIHHAVLQVERDRKGHLTKLLTRDEKLAKKKSGAKKGAGEAFVFVEIDRRNEAKALEGLRLELLQVLSEVRIAVDDYETMRQYALDSRKEIKKNKQFSSDDLTEATAFINWLADDHFTFLGYDEYEFTRRDNDIELRRIKGSELGILKSHNERPGTAYLSELPRKTREHLLKPDIFAFAKSAQRSRVHRPAYPDYVSIKKFDSDGNVIGERRFLGLYTATVYQQRHSEIPLIRAKTASVIERSGLDTNEYGRKELEQVLAVYPRDDLFQIDADELFRVAMGIMYIQERRKIRLFIREDAYAQFVSAMVFVPRDIYNTDLRLKMEHILCTELEAEDIEFTTHFSESVLARTQFNIRVKQKDDRIIDVDALQNKIVEAAQSWKDGFREALYEAHGEELANTYIHLYENAFPAAYREEFSPRRAVIDVDHMAEVNRDKPISMSFYRALEELDHTLHFKLFHPEEQLPLSDVLPIFENLGLK
ncbi:MAG: NAD-glutamate dehydrogenase, partial [Pseudomonadales bacterium]|nr:NAD-glutamate dehydrogenase [Pseudomonadales bacterium]